MQRALLTLLFVLGSAGLTHAAPLEGRWLGPIDPDGN